MGHMFRISLSKPFVHGLLTVRSKILLIFIALSISEILIMRFSVKLPLLLVAFSIVFPAVSQEKPVEIPQDNPVAAMADSILNLKLFQHNNQKLQAQRQNKFGFSSDSVPVYDVSVIKNRLAKLDAASPFKYEYNKHVAGYIEMYSKRKRNQVERMLGMAQLYYPLFEEKLDKHDIPLELKHLAVVESGLNANAKSHAGAVGLWQFMYATGKMYGLNTNSYVDERRDPIKATEAACLYLKSLYKMFGDWHLALAAYNAGPGTVNKAIRRSGGKTNYWELMPYLPRETNGYVPAFIAASYVMTYHQEHNLYPETPKYFYNQVDTVYVKQETNLNQLAEALKIEIEDLEFLNPAYHKGIIPVYRGSLPLYLPSSLTGDFLAMEEEFYKKNEEIAEKAVPVSIETKQVTKYYTVRSGDHLSLIARKYNCSITDLRRWNNLPGNTIYTGQKLTVKAQEQTAVTSSVKAPVAKQKHSVAEAGLYTVQPGDTLWDIAVKYKGVSVDEIIRLNNLRDGNSIKPGMKLKITKG